MKTALIGYTGFVGSNLLDQTHFNYLYNSHNIDTIKNKKYDLIVSAANSSLIWKANLNPDIDHENIQKFIQNIKQVTAKHFVLLSTIEVYDNTALAYEDTKINPSRLLPYGKNRLELERFVQNNYASYTIIRMPNLFGKKLKKNFVFDLIHLNHLDFTHYASQLQWYNLNNLWKDIEIALSNNLQIINFAVEPIECKTLALATLNLKFSNITEKPPRIYNMRSNYSYLYNSNNSYLYDKISTLAALKLFIKEERSLI